MRGWRTQQYFKVVDSDDWVNLRAYLKILEQYNALEETGEEVDVFYTNFVYEKKARETKIMRYTAFLKIKCLLGWCEATSSWEVYDMHSLIYNMKLLRKSGLQLPERVLRGWWLVFITRFNIRPSSI